MNNKIKKKLVKNWFKDLQDLVCYQIEEIENYSSNFKIKEWKRDKKKNNGGGEYRILENGKVFEKVGVNFSEVYGKFSKEFRNQIPGANKNPNFWASGISIVMHMKNPHVPAMHFNTRYISTSHSWFGGGIDVTPCFKDNKLKSWFHSELKKCCDRHNKKYYKKYKKWCDEYFYLPHMNEPRGIGGIFFDYLHTDDWGKDFEFIQDVGLYFQNFVKNTLSSLKDEKWSDDDKQKQLSKRSRYAEFNLLYDRGTKFGLETGGNIDAILMSMPPLAKWD